MSKNGECAYRRTWDSEPFKELYSSRCATVNSHINPQGLVCRTYGTKLIEDLYAGVISPEAVGKMTEAQMCPESVRAEKEEIELRRKQRMIQKASDLFKCPHCGARHSDYIEKQTAALDEPRKIVCTCLECGKKFRGG